MPELPSDNRLVRSAREYGGNLFSGDYARTFSSGNYAENLPSENCAGNLFSEEYARTFSSEDYDDKVENLFSEEDNGNLLR